MTKQQVSTQQVADRFHELAQQEKWFEIQDELFSDDIRSIDPEGSPYMGFAEGRADVRQKGEEFIKTITAVHSASTSAPLVTGNHFVVARELDMTLQTHGQVQMHELMLYEVKDGKIVLEQFFY